MLQLVGLDIIVKGDRRRLLVAIDDPRTTQWLEGGRELERIYDRFFCLNCSVAVLFAAVELMKRGVAVERAFARSAA